jgi:hypothetical protein
MLLALLVGMLGLGQQASATPLPLDPDLLPIEVPANGAFGIGLIVDPNFNSNGGFLFQHLTEQGGLFSIHSAFSSGYEYLTCVNSNPAPGEPGHVIPAFAEGSLIDASLATGDCFFASNTSQGRLLAADFDESGAFIAVRSNFSAPYRYGFLHARIDPDGVLRILNGAVESDADVPIEATTDPQTVFRDRFESLTGTSADGNTGDET